MPSAQRYRGARLLMEKVNDMDGTPVPMMEEKKEKEVKPKTKVTEKKVDIKTEIPVRFSRDEEFMMMAIEEAQTA